jgi:LacI family transcriptional regulator
MTSRRRVALLMDVHTSYDHGVARGIIRYARQHGTWRLFGQGWTLAQVPDPRTWDGHGIITRVHHPREVAALLAPGVPVVDVCRTSPHPRVHSSANDDEETGRIAGRYFLTAGHRHFAFCGSPEGVYSHRRLHGFATELGLPETEIETFLRPRAWWHRPGGVPSVLKTWVRRVALPVAIFAADDAIGVKIARACAELGVRIPEQVSLVGVDNEEVLCELANPPLSSIPCDTERMGYEAARLLDRLMDEGEPKRALHVSISPLPIIERGSSNRFGTEDQVVLAALRQIHHSEQLSIHVPDVVALSGISRRALELRFRKELGRSIHDEISQARLDRACRLLTTTDQAIGKVALASGFASPQRFHTVFRRRFGTLPTQYRAKHRGPLPH